MKRLKENLFFLLCVFTFSYLSAAGEPEIPYEGLTVKKVTVTFQNQAPSDRDNEEAITKQLGTKTNAPFSQETFD